MCFLFLRGYAAGIFTEFAHVAQLVEHILGKDEVNGSIPFVGLEREMNMLRRK